MNYMWLLGLMVAGLLNSPLVYAEEALAINPADTAWLLTSAALVMFMTPGLALFYGGLVRSKNALNMFMKVFSAMGLITVLWVVVGYSLAFNNVGLGVIGGLNWIMLNGVGLDPSPDYASTVPHQLFMVFQMMFAIITPAIIAGGVAERMKFSSFVVFMGLWSLFVYAPLAYMVWGDGGFLGSIGKLDFAGGTVVHISSGFSALVLAIILGRRKIAYNEDPRPHNLPFTLFGAGILWFGWFGFNAGSALAADGVAVNAFVVTHVSSATAALVWILLESAFHGKPTALGFATGIVAGLVAITPAAGFVDVTGAIILGSTVSVVCLFAIRLKSALGYDDSLDAFGVHGVGGLWGALLLAFLANPAVDADATGLFYGGSINILVTQCIGVGVGIGVAVVGTIIIATIISVVMGLRVEDEEEQTGLDVHLHGEIAYNTTK